MIGLAKQHIIKQSYVCSIPHVRRI
uniref:Uncharacterized protein n=1 Tax=Rhizophora mucronata TaxID=61149 RepID=A0A2P2NZS6_RHIMU